MRTVRIKLTYDPNSKNEGTLVINGINFSICALGLDLERNLPAGKYQLKEIKALNHELFEAYGPTVVTFQAISGPAKQQQSVKASAMVLHSGVTSETGKLYRVASGIRVYQKDLQNIIALLSEAENVVLEVIQEKNGFIKKMTTKKVSNSAGKQVRPRNYRNLDGFDEDDWDEMDYLFAWILYSELVDDFDTIDDDDWQEDMEPYGEEDDLEESALDMDQLDAERMEDSAEYVDDDEDFSSSAEPESGIFGTPTDTDMDDVPLVSDPFDPGFSLSDTPDVVDNDVLAEDQSSGFKSDSFDDYSSDGGTDY